MSKLQKYVKSSRNSRAGSPQNGEPPVNPHRQAIAANARVQMKPSVARPHKAQEFSVSGESVVQHQSASVQLQYAQRPRSGEGQVRDPYDTDGGESLDTTINHSVIQVENSPQLPQQLLQPVSADSESDDEGAFDEDEEPEIDEELDMYLAQHNMADASYEDRMRFLQDTQPQLFPTIDGDSYPTTTDGNPTELDDQQRSTFEDFVPLSNFTEHHQQSPNTSLLRQQPQQGNLSVNVAHIDTAVLQNSKLWSQGAQIRGQQRTSDAVRALGQSGQKHDPLHLATSHPAIYTQVNQQQGMAAPLLAQARPEIIVQSDTGGLSPQIAKVPEGSGPPQHTAPEIPRPTAVSKPAPLAHAQIVPILEQYLEPAMVEEPSNLPEGDYDPDTLFKMNYDQLRDESFDKSPRKANPVLDEDICSKPLSERLPFVQHHLDPQAQSGFFDALPTNEWEEAGDWFLDQFSAVIKKTREARQKKRKAAQEFEKEVEKRHKHVAKKQRLVEGALAKMKSQGEGLVPKSPRPRTK